MERRVLDRRAVLDASEAARRALGEDVDRWEPLRAAYVDEVHRTGVGFTDNLKDPYAWAVYVHYTGLLERVLPRDARVVDWGGLYGHVTALLRARGFARAENYLLFVPPSYDAFATRFGIPTTYGTDPNRLALPDTSADCVISSGVLEHVREDGKGREDLVLRDIRRVLRPGGVLAVWNLPTTLAAADLWGKLRGRWYHRYRYAERDVRRMLEEAGLELLHLERHGGSLPAAAAKALRAHPAASTAWDVAWGRVPLARATSQNFAFLARRPLDDAARAPGPVPAAPRFTVAVTVRNDRANLEALFASLLAQDMPASEVVVVDGGSDDGSLAAAEAFRDRAPFPVTVAREPGPRGVGRTRCLELATGDVVAFVDSDCTVPPEWLARYAKAWEAESGREGRPLGALGGAGVTPPESTPLQRAIEDVMGPAEAMSFHGVNTINCCYLRRAAVEAGGFDPALHTAEDPDLNARVAKLGYRLVRVDNPCAHRRRDSWRKLVRQHFEYGRGARTLLVRHPEYFPWYERWIAPGGAAAGVALAALGVLVDASFLALLAALVVGTPYVVHRGFVRRFVREHGLSRGLLLRLGVLWVAYAPYQLGVLVGRAAGRRA